MITINNPDIVTIFCKYLYDINQYMKNVYNYNGFYNYENGIIVCNSDEQISPYITAYPIFSKKELDIKNILSNISFTIVGGEYYSFFKDYKKNITEIEITNTYIRFKTDLPLLEKVFPKTNVGNKPYQSDKLSSENEIGILRLRESECRYIKELGNSPFEIYLDFGNGRATINERPNDDYLQLTMNVKFIVGYKQTVKFVSELAFSVYDFNSDKNLYLIDMVNTTDKLEVHQYMVITDLVEEEQGIVSYTN